MNDTQYSGAHRICNLAADTLAAENLELRDDLESYRTLALAFFYVIGELAKRNNQLANRIDQLRPQIEELMNAPCLSCRRRSMREAAMEPLTV